jgi:hypothetical protein
MTTMTTRILPADTFDTLELTALVFGGVGAGIDHIAECPVCVYGLADAAHPTSAVIAKHLIAADITRYTNDCAVRRINRRLRGRADTKRVQFADWCAELGVERGS